MVNDAMSLRSARRMGIAEGRIQTRGLRGRDVPILRL